MSTMEESLRRALEGGDVSDPAFRESIYAASERALERMLETRGADERARADQRARLAETIDRVEAEHVGAEADGPGYDEAPAGDWDAEADGPHETAARSPRAFDAHEAEGTADEAWTPGAAASTAEARPARSPLLVPAAAVVFAVLLAVLAYVVAGALRGDGAVPAASDGSAAVQSGAQVAAGSGDLGWIDVFDGNDLDALSTPNGGRIETVSRPDEREAIRISAPTGGQGEVLLTLGAGVMRQIAGRQVRIELTAGSPNESLREFGIRCIAADQSFCAQQSFATAMSEEAFVFDVAVPPGVMSAGSIAIGPGLNGTPNDVDIYALRIRALG